MLRYDDPDIDRILHVVQVVLVVVAAGSLYARDLWPSIWWGVGCFVAAGGIVAIGAYRHYDEPEREPKRG